MCIRCPDARPGVPAVLKGWRLTFRGVADIERADRRIVYGALWQLSQEDLVALDSYEGAPSHYRRRIIEVRTNVGVSAATTYVMTDGSYLGLPSSWYLGRIEEGFRDWGLPIGELPRSVEETRHELARIGVVTYVPDSPKRMKAAVPAGALEDRQAYESHSN